MKVYGILSRVPFLKRYSFKFLFVAFLGIHIPLLAVIGVILYNQGGSFSAMNVFLLVLVFTLIATVITLLTLNSLLAPLLQTKTSLEQYAENGQIPNIPTGYNDEAGIVMKNVQNTIVKIENMLSTQRDLTSLLSHDLRTPIAEMIGVAQVMDPEDKEEHQMMVNQIVNSGENLLEMLQSILTMMKLDTLELSQEDKAKINLYEMVNHVIEQSSARLKAKDLQVSNEVNPEAYVEVNKAFFEHVVSNLINNAIKFSHEGNMITLSSLSNNGEVSLIVKDRGIGLESGTENLIFQRFTKHGRTGTQNEKSTGLGLYLTKRIVELHNGKIEAKSEGKDKGTTFKVKIPA
ncbi:MAG: hypothetical protein CMB80_30475 [Flammeovirgaceae bacterium]|nr:hypothetical protein [Flammeovirgaceae bacterium]MBE60853.1 hypothetical protein [Flammeovirgaceae bacterium]MBR08206.1 hypothetical protein [Rickettsiales bacterium]HCX21500.1 hypothetical protein [Cytophagales bacterium]